MAKKKKPTARKAADAARKARTQKRKNSKRRTNKPDRATWRPPKEMGAAQARRVLAGKECGRRIALGKYCDRPPKPGGTHLRIPYRCEVHYDIGGPAHGNKNALKHGIYADCLMEGEAELWDLLTTEDVEDEIRITKLRLKRAMRAEREQAERLESLSEEERIKAAELREYSYDSRLTTGKGGETSGTVRESKTYRLVDYGHAVHMIQAELAALMRYKAALQEGSGGLEPETYAERLVAALGDMEGTVPDE